MTLSDAVFWSKVVARLLLFSAILLVGGYYGYQYWVSISTPQSVIFQPDNACGLLPNLEIEQLPGVDVSGAQIKVESISSALPDVPFIAYVYRIDSKGETFATQNRALEIAEAFRFKPDSYTKPSPDKYQWRDEYLLRTLTIDAASLNFTLQKDQTTIPGIPNNNLPSKIRAVEVAKTMLTAGKVLTDDLSNAEAFVYPVIYKNGVPSEVSAIENAQLVRVDLQKKTKVLYFDRRILKTGFTTPSRIDFVQYLKTPPQGNESEYYREYTAPRVGKTPYTSNVQVYIHNQNGGIENGAFYIYYQNWNTEEFPCGTYRIIPPSEAVKKIGEGKGKIVLLTEKGGDTLLPHSVQKVTEIEIFKIQLAYYETPEQQNFLQPIYVATGQVKFSDTTLGEIGIYIEAIDQQ